MTRKMTARRHIAFSTLFVFVLLCAARAVSLWYSYAATDILYIETVLPDVLFYARQILSMIAFGAGIAAVMFAVFRFGKSRGGAVFGILAAIFFADHLCAFLIDVLSGAVSDAQIPLAARITVLEWIWNSLLLLSVLVIALRSVRRGTESDRALLGASLATLGAWLFLEIVYLVDSLILAGFSVTPSGVVLIVGSFLSVIVLNGGVVWVAAGAFFALYSRLFGEKSE